MASDNFKEKGRWSELFSFPNVIVHATLLPDGTVLCWGRRKDATPEPSTADMSEHSTVSYLWTPPAYPKQPTKGTGFGKIDLIKDENQPIYNPDGKKDVPVNLFCSGHCLLPSGNLLVVGGHERDAHGVEQAAIFDYKAKKWIPQPKMNRGRWYPSAITLPDGRVLCLSGSDGLSGSGEYDANNNNIPQVFSETGTKTWVEATDAHGGSPDQVLMLDLYPRIHINPTNGQVFMVGPKPDSWSFKLKEADGITPVVGPTNFPGQWIKSAATRSALFRDYAPSVMYDSGKIMYIGGGTNTETPSDITEFIDLTSKDPPNWDAPDSARLKKPRKQFNATILPDGTVFVNGGTRGWDFNDTTQAELSSELMDPSKPTKQWDVMNPETLSRCYHGTSLLLPDGRVLSAGSGEALGIPAAECHKEGQLFEPPYLFKGNRPTFSGAPPAIDYNQIFSVTLGTKDLITKVSWVRLGSVTHCRNMNQSYMTLVVVKQDGQRPGSKLSVRAPKDANTSPPGHYMLFVLNATGIPSVGCVIQIPTSIKAAPKPSGQTPMLSRAARHTENATILQPSLIEHDEKVTAGQDQPHVVVGLTPLCPYGLGACWGGAYDGLRAVKDVSIVRPVPNSTDCLAFVYLKKDIIPDISVWRREFEGVANKSYVMRGIEMEITGVITVETSGTSKQLTLAGTLTRAKMTLTPFQKTSQLKWDAGASVPKPVTNTEIGAYDKLLTICSSGSAGLNVQVTGTLQSVGDGKYSLDVRDFKVAGATS